MTTTTLESVTATIKDMYPRPGERIKQWVVDAQREYQWELETCPRFFVHRHIDNTGLECRNAGPTPWIHLNHDCCYTCGDMHGLFSVRPETVEWVHEKAKRPPIETDRSKLSDEIAPDTSMTEHPMLAAFKERK